MDSGFHCTDEFDNAQRCTPLECHYGQSDDIRIKFPNQALDRLAYLSLSQYQVRYRRPVMRIDVPGK
jgi:hypothetical protein